MKQLGRRVIAVLTGLVMGLICLSIIELIGMLLFPLPEGVDPTDETALREIAAQIPAGAFVSIVAAWFAGTFIGSYVTARLAPDAPRAHAAGVTALLLAAGVSNMLMIPHPLWVWVSGILAFLIGGDLGMRVALRPVGGK